MESDAFDPYIPLDKVKNALLYDAGPNAFTKIYCNCGRIVDIDRGTYLTKLRLNKRIECPYCRNERISQELELLDENYSVIEEQPIYGSPERCPVIGSRV